MKTRFKTLAYSITIGIVLLVIATAITSCEEDEDGFGGNNSRCPSGMSSLGNAADDYTCMVKCSNATVAGKTAIWHRMDNKKCCCTK